MASITLNKPSGGQLTLSPEDGTSNETVTIPSVGVGKVLQVVQTVHTSQLSSTSNSFVATGITASITPQSTTSKIIVMYDVQWQIDTTPSSGGLGLQIYRNGSFLIGDDTGYRTAYTQLSAVGDRPRGRASFTYLDSPSSTSTQTYELWWATWDAATTYISEGGTTPSTITLMEVAA